VIGQNYLAGRVDKFLLDIERRREELMANVAQAVAIKREGKDRVDLTGEYETIKTA
jgi:hypothetical protein